MLTRKAFQDWGRIGGRTRARRLSKARRKQIAKIAGSAKKTKSTYIPTGVSPGRPSRINIPEAIASYRAGDTLELIGSRYQMTRERIRQVLKKNGVLSDEGGQAIRSFLKTETRVKMQQAALLRAEKIARKRWGIPADEYRALVSKYGNTSTSKSPLNRYKQQKRSAHTRVIEWKLSFREWWDIWQKSGKWDQRGKGSRYGMARIGDSGPYAVGNVEIITGKQNSSDSYLVHPASTRRSAKNPLALSPRQQEAAVMLDGGLNCSEIAKKMGIAYGVAYSHCNAAKKKRAMLEANGK